MKDVKISEHDLIGGKIAILKYTGSDDPVLHLDEAVRLYVGNIKHTEMVDMNIDNPWIRVILSDIDKVQESAIDFSEISRDIRLGHLLSGE